MVGLTELESVTSCVSSRRSNQLSYKPLKPKSEDFESSHLYLNMARLRYPVGGAHAALSGIALPDEITSRLSRLINQLRPAAEVRWSPAYNLHVTTKFIGEWPEEPPSENRGRERVPPSQTRAIRSNPRVGFGSLTRITASVLGADRRSANVLAATLTRRTDETLAKLGSRPKREPFSPDLTLGRIRRAGPDLLNPEARQSRK